MGYSSKEGEKQVEFTQFLTALWMIIRMDIVLGGDNAVLIAMASRNLPQKQRTKAVWLGASLAIMIRVILTLFAVWLLSVPMLMMIGGIVLIYIALKLIIQKKNKTSIQADSTLIGAIKTIVMADVIMGLDNVLAIAGASHGNFFLIVLGLLFSIPIIIWGSRVILTLLDKYPLIIYIGAAILAYTAGGMIVHEPLFAGLMANQQYLNWLIPIISIFFVISIAYVWNRRVKKTA